MLSLYSRTLLTDLVLVALPTDLFRRPRSIGLSGLRRFSTLADTEDVRNDVSSACGASLCLVPQGDLDVRLALRIRVVLRILAQTLPVLVRSSLMLERGSRPTLWMMNSSSLIFPARTCCPMVVKYSWMFSTTTSVASPERIWSRHLLVSIQLLACRFTDPEMVLDRARYSRRFISKPLASVDVRVRFDKDGVGISINDLQSCQQRTNG